MARFDKVIRVARAGLAADADPADFDKVLAASLNASGKMLTGEAGNSGYVGITIVDRTKRRAGQVQDIMDVGEVVEVDGLDAGTKYYVQDDGSLGDTRTAIYVGYTVEADRLVVQFDAKEDAAP